jgi:hypothetical protein
MRALTVKQPYAWAIVHGGKTVENRRWSTPFRGRFYLHAGVGWDRDGPGWIEREIGIDVPRREDLLFGAIIGTVELYDVVSESDSPWAEPDNYYWLLRNPKPLRRPIRVLGQLGWWSYTRGAA